MSKVSLKIDGQAVQAEAGSTILQAAEGAGIRIPTLCYHPALPAEGACRICVVEVAKQRLLLPACTYPVAEGMEVLTESPQVVEARRFVLELLLSDHPQDCLTCEANGDCELQDLAYRYQVKRSRFQGEVHRYPLDEANPFIARDMTKCILCRRCVGACHDIQAVDAIGLAHRGFDTKVAAAFDASLQDSTCVFCGQCVAVCPVGALTEKNARFLGRSWEMTRVTTVCPYCGVGCLLDLNVKDNRIIKVTSNWEGPANRGATCVKGRFGYEFVHSPDRLTRPLIKADGAFVEASWEEALDLVARRLAEIKGQHGPDSLAVLASAKCTNEENYLLQKFARAVLGTNNVDHCARL